MTWFPPTPASASLLDRLQTPVWIFDIERERMHYANAAALRLWNAETHEALYGRDWSSTMSEASRQRLADYLPRLAAGEPISEQWTFYPGGEGISVHCRCSGLPLEDGRTGMLVEGLESAPLLDASSLRALEAVRHSPLMVSVFDGAGRILMRNPAALRTRRGEAGFVEAFEDRALARRLLERLAHRPECTLEAAMRVGDGPRWHRLDLCRATDPQTAEPMIVMSELDISRRRELEQARLLAKRQLEVVIEGLNVGLLLEDEHRTVIVANQAFCDLFEVAASPERLTGLDCREALRAARAGVRDPATFAARVEALVTGEEAPARDVVAMADGRFLERSYTPVIVDRRHRGHLWGYRDITRQKRQEADWAHQASTDALTGLANRRTFDDEVQRVAASVREAGPSAALLMIDIDRFKAINDTHGHVEGDRALCLLADCLRRRLREADLPCRTGGEEFMVIMPDTAPATAERVARRLCRAIAERSLAEASLPFHFTVSIGVTAFKADDDGPAALTRRADAAMYRAKRAGRNRVAARW
ncbi:sensor domain-containing diguanylate cyclase [Halomonas koreensis]|uniref:diguanylate cyclase n=1 Tax=Halomonas koreensis TaxID=245385 RepID=A0ABU1G1T5_9GAMM|nr:diguanylate cyclase [Halomonas koreensis]MDR5866442.1 diguanylate cyclase [Halomonas koreensis]